MFEHQSGRRTLLKAAVGLTGGGVSTGASSELPPPPPSPGVQLIETAGVAQATTIPADILVIETSGRLVSGDRGGARYVRRAVEPSHLGKLQTADGAWWELLPEADGSASVYAFGDPNEASTITDTLTYGRPIRFPAGTYAPDDITLTEAVDIVLEPGCYLDSVLTITGDYAIKEGASVSVTAGWAQMPAGTTTVSGDFSAFAPGDTVMVELPDRGSAGQGNQTGIDILTVSAASASSISFTTPTRFPYRNPIISRIVQATRHTGTLARDQVTVPGDYRAFFAVGDVLRIENVDGTDGVEGSSAYFELNRVADISATEITLETNLTHAHVNPWIFKAGVVGPIRISGEGRVRRLVIKNAVDVYIDGAEVDRQVVTFCYQGWTLRSRRRGLGEASTSNLTFSWNFHVSDIQCGGAVSSTDNAAFKVLGCPNLQMTNISGGDTKASSQGAYGVFVDYFFTPYKVWNENLQARNVRGETPNGGSPRASWFTGIRNGTLELAGSRTFLQRLVDTTANVTCTGAELEVQDCNRSRISGDALFVDWEGCKDCIADVTVRSPGGANANRCFWAKPGSIDPEDGSSVPVGENNEFNVVNYSANASDVTLYIQSQTDPVIGSGCRDKAGLSASVLLGSSVTDPVCQPCLLRNSMPISDSWQGSRMKGYLTLDGDYRDGGLTLGGRHLWTDSVGRLRSSTTPPTSQADGEIVGTQS